MILIEEFIPDAVLMSNRAFYMILIKASCEYLIELKIEQPKTVYSSSVTTNQHFLTETDVVFELPSVEENEV